MCRVEERIYINGEGHRSSFEDTFPCDKFRNGRLCGNVKRRTTEYYPGKSGASDEDKALPSSPVLTPTGAGSYLVQQRRPSTRDPPNANKPEIKIEFGDKNLGKTRYNSVTVPSGGHKRAVRVATVESDSDASDASYTIRTGFSDAPLPPPNSFDFAASRAAGNYARSTASGSSNSASSQVPSLTWTSDGDDKASPAPRRPRYPPTIVHNPPISRYSSNSSNSRSTAPKYSSGLTNREQERQLRREEARQQEELDREITNELPNEANRKAVRFDLGRAKARAQQRAETILAEKEKERAEERERHRRTKGPFLVNKMPLAEIPAFGVHPPSTARPRRGSLTEAQRDEKTRLFALDAAHMQREREAAEVRERELRAILLRLGQEDGSYHNPRGGDRIISASASRDGRRGSTSRRDLAYRNITPPPGLARSHSDRRMSIIQVDSLPMHSDRSEAANDYPGPPSAYPQAPPPVSYHNPTRRPFYHSPLGPRSTSKIYDDAQDTRSKHVTLPTSHLTVGGLQKKPQRKESPDLPKGDNTGVLQSKLPLLDLADSRRKTVDKLEATDTNAAPKSVPDREEAEHLGMEPEGHVDQAAGEVSPQAIELKEEDPWRLPGRKKKKKGKKGIGKSPAGETHASPTNAQSATGAVSDVGPNGESERQDGQSILEEQRVDAATLTANAKIDQEREELEEKVEAEWHLLGEREELGNIESSTGDVLEVPVKDIEVRQNSARTTLHKHKIDEWLRGDMVLDDSVESAPVAETHWSETWQNPSISPGAEQEPLEMLPLSSVIEDSIASGAVERETESENSKQEPAHQRNAGIVISKDNNAQLSSANIDTEQPMHEHLATPTETSVEELEQFVTTETSIIPSKQEMDVVQGDILDEHRATLGPANSAKTDSWSKREGNLDGSEENPPVDKPDQSGSQRSEKTGFTLPSESANIYQGNGQQSSPRSLVTEVLPKMSLSVDPSMFSRSYSSQMSQSQIMEQHRQMGLIQTLYTRGLPTEKLNFTMGNLDADMQQEEPLKFAYASLSRGTDSLPNCFEPFADDSDDESNGSSYANSVMSVATLASTANDFSIHSKYSAVQIAEATKELTIILRDDIFLVPLYKRAVADISIGPERLARNLRRFFKTYAEHLGKEAGDTLELLASRLVQAKARAVAQHIVANYNIKAAAGLSLEQKEHEDESSDEDSKAVPVDESLFGDLVLFREFLVGSESFVTLRAQIGSFVLPRSAREEVVNTAEVFIDTDGVAMRADVKQALPTTTKCRRTQPYPRPIEIIKQAISSALVAADYLEPSLKPEFTRLRWRCVSIHHLYRGRFWLITHLQRVMYTTTNDAQRCGETLFGDACEYREGGVAKMVERMQRTMGVKVIVTSYGNGTSNQTYRFKFPAWMRGTSQKVSAALGHSTKSSPCLPQHTLPNTQATNAPANVPPPPQETLHLMACMQRGRYRRTVVQEPIQDIVTDRALFSLMRSQLARHRGHVRKFFSLKCVQGLYFVKVSALHIGC